MPTYQLNLPMATIEADLVRIQSEDYVLIRSQDLLKLFAPMQRTARRQPTPAATNSHQRQIIAPPDEKPHEAFTDLVLIAMKNLGPASGPEILQDLIESEVACTQQKVSGALTYLKKKGRVSYNADKNQWTREED